MYEFEVEISAPIERKRKFVALRLQTSGSSVGSYQGKIAFIFPL